MSASSAGVELVGWVLRRRRQRWQEITGTTSRDFLRELTDRGLVADASRLSRWELGRMVARPAVLAGYEQVAGVLPMTLQAFANRVLRHQRPQVGLLPIEATDEEGMASLDRILLDPAATRAVDSADGARAVWTLLRCNSYVAPPVAERLASVLVDRVVLSAGPSALIAGDSLAQAMTHPRLRDAVLARSERYLAASSSGGLTDLPQVLAEASALADDAQQSQTGCTAAYDAGHGHALRPVAARPRGDPDRYELARVGQEVERVLEEPADRHGGHGLCLGVVVGRMVAAESSRTAHLYGLAFSAMGGDSAASRLLLSMALDADRGEAIRLRLLRALRYSPSADIAGELEAALVSRDRSLSPALRRQLCLVRGHVHGRPLALSPVRVMLDADELAPAAVHALGLSGSPDLAELSAAPWLSAPLRVRVRWWLDRGAAVAR